MTKLSVKINKFATLRNSRGGNNPDVAKAAVDVQRFGHFFNVQGRRHMETELNFTSKMDLPIRRPTT